MTIYIYTLDDNMITASHIFNISLSSFDIKDKSLRYRKKKG